MAGEANLANRRIRSGLGYVAPVVAKPPVAPAPLPKPLAPKPLTPKPPLPKDPGGLISHTGQGGKMAGTAAVGAPKPAAVAKPATRMPTPATPATPAAPNLSPTSYGAPPTPYGSASVAQRVTDLVGQDSPVMQAARTEGYKAMNRRGLMNSNMAEGAAEDAMIKSALPIASQDASQAFQGGENQLGREQTEREHVRDIGQAEYAQGQDLAEQRYAQANDINFRSKENAADRFSTENIAALTRQSQEKVASWQLKSEDRGQAAQFVTNMESEYQQYISSVLGNTALDATSRTALLNGAKQLRDRQLNLAEQLYIIDLKW